MRLRIAVGLLSVSCAPLFGWGDVGHQTIADVAEKALISSPQTMAQIKAVFGPSFRLRDIATCADRLRDFVRFGKMDAACAPLITKIAPPDQIKTQFPHSDKWHFVNIPVDSTKHTVADAPSFCGTNSCAAAEIIRLTKQLSPTATTSQKAEAILFLTHLVGDIHQPLHSADRNDAGGNSFHVTFFDSSMSLHHAWDDSVLERGTHGALTTPLPAPGSTDPWQWAVDAYNQAVKVAYDDIPSDGQIADSAAYEVTADKVATMQIQLAGVRLAKILSDKLGPPAGATPAPAPAPKGKSTVPPPPPAPTVPPVPGTASHDHNATEFLPSKMTKSTGCKVNGALPDPACTPGAVMGISTTEVCTTSTKGRRAVTTEMKAQVYASYGLQRQPEGTYEVDHFIPLELGGSNDLANLWPEAANPKPGFKEKDCVETYLHNQVCKLNTMSLADAQRAISTNWLDVYNNQAKGSCK
jgi:hypothetical protein